MKVLLFSGIPLSSKNSFYWQLTLLKEGFIRRGIDSILISPISDSDAKPNTSSIEGIEFLDYRGRGALHLIEEYCPDAGILLGYPQDFSFMSEIYLEKKNPCMFIWAQFSKPPILNEIFRKRINFVPLTKKTLEYCIKSEVKNILNPIPHGVPLNIYHPFDGRDKIRLKYRFDLDGKFVVGTVAKNIIRKRLNDVIKAFAESVKNMDNSFLIIKTDREVSDAGYSLPQIIQKYSIQGKSRIILGDFNRTEMAELYNSMDVYIQLSEWEGFGIPVIEAMACGLPVVTHEVQGPGEIVDGAGIVVSSSKHIDDSGACLSFANTVEAANALHHLYIDKELRVKLSRRAVAVAKEKYDIEKVIDMWIKTIMGRI